MSGFSVRARGQLIVALTCPACTRFLHARTGFLRGAACLMTAVRFCHAWMGWLARTDACRKPVTSGESQAVLL